MRSPALTVSLLLGLVSPLGAAELDGAPSAKPNILWILAEDLSPWMGCYGDLINAKHTPTIDRLAAEGVLFRRAYATAPVCSASRSALITGVQQTTTGTHQHRSSRTTDGEVVPEALRIYLPAGIKTLPELMKAQGYFTFNSGKDDYNFHYNRLELYDVGSDPSYRPGQNGWQGNQAEHWKSFTQAVWGSRPDRSQPWFGQIQIDGGKGDKRYLPKSDVVDPSSVDLPPYFPESPALRAAWAEHFTNARGSDVRIAQILRQLEADGELENTVIFFFSDHGANSSLRHKQFCYEGGLHVPLVIQGRHPAIPRGKVVDDLVSLLDVTATTLALAGAKVPEYYDGQNLFDPDYRPADFIVSSRDRCDYSIDRIRSVRTDRYRYIRNYYPDRPLMQPAYRDNLPESVDMRRLHAEGKLTEYQEDHWFGIRPSEELYDLQADPHEMNNLAYQPLHHGELRRHRRILDQWIKETNDQGQYPESVVQLEATYRLWEDKPMLRNVELNPEYRQLKKP